MHVRVSLKSMPTEATEDTSEDNSSLGNGLAFLDDKTSTSEVVDGLARFSSQRESPYVTHVNVVINVIVIRLARCVTN